MMTKFPFPSRDYDFAPYVRANNWIGGEWAPSLSGNTEEVFNPRHGRAMGTVVYSNAADVQIAYEVAKKAFDSWKEWPVRERAQVLHQVKVLMEQNFDELAWLLSHENGKSIGQARGSVLKGIECVEMGDGLTEF